MTRDDQEPCLASRSGCWLLKNLSPLQIFYATSAAMAVAPAGGTMLSAVLITLCAVGVVFFVFETGNDKEKGNLTSRNTRELLTVGSKTQERGSP